MTVTYLLLSLTLGAIALGLLLGLIDRRQRWQPVPARIPHEPRR